MSSLLKNSLYAAYRDSPDILDMFDLLDWTQLTHKFQSELDKRMDRDTVEICQKILTSDIIHRYDTAVAESVQACTNNVSQLLELVLVQNESGRLN